MTAKKASARGYLAQLAEPVPAGDPAFSARRDLLAPSGSLPIQPPVIQDVVEHRAAQPVAARAHSQPGMASASDGMRNIRWPAPRSDRTTVAVGPAAAESAVRETTSQERSTSANGQRRQVLSGDYVSPLPASARGVGSAQRPSQQDSGGNSVDRSIGSNWEANSDRSATPVISGSRAKSASSQDRLTIDSATANEAIYSPIGEKYTARAQFTGADRTAVERVMKSEPRRFAFSDLRVRPEPMQETSTGNPPDPNKTAWNRSMNNPRVGQNGKAAQESSARTGPQVRIGTIEIRTKMAQPATPVLAPVQRNTDSPASRANARPGGGAGAADSLARSLAWNYGLIQG